MNHSGSLWLEREPSVEEVKNEFSKFDMNKYKEVVFCGFGEPTERLDDVLEVCRFIKDKYNKTIRINTNGLADLIHKKNTAPMFDGLIDIVSISLNTPNKERYLELASQLKPLLSNAKGFIRSERFSSLNAESKLLSLNVWESEEAVEKWRNELNHRMSQLEGREKLFESYRITVASVIREYDDCYRNEAPVDSNEYFRHKLGNGRL